MGSHLLNIDFDNIASLTCVIISTLLVATFLVVLFKFGAYAISQVEYMF